MSTHLEIELHSRPEAPRPAVVEIRYGQVGLVQVRISTTDPGAILDELTGRVATAPHFFRRTAVCLELAALETPPDVAAVQAVIDALRRAGMLVVGLSGDLAALDTLSSGLNLPVVSTFRTAGRPVPIVQPVASAPERLPAPPEPAPVQEQPGAAALIHTQTVRSGQRIHARHRDLIVTASVGAGAEVMADGCVHVYGSLRGRAMAGVHGQLSARVFCQQFYAELVSIAGIFRVFETLPPELSGAPVQAWLMGEDLHVARLK